MKNLICIVSSWLLLTSAGVQAQQPISQVDPTDSSMWGYLQQQFIPNQPYHFDSRISVNTPLFAEDSTQVPISIDASAIKDINMIMVLADISPFQKVMEIWPGDFEPIFSFNMKVQQATAVRAMVLDKHGHWHVGSTGGRSTTAQTSRIPSHPAKTGCSGGQAGVPDAETAP